MTDSPDRSKFQPSNDLLVTCQVCGDRMKAIKHLHLKKHGMNQAQYLAKFPGAQIDSKAQKKISTHEGLTVEQRALSAQEELVRVITEKSLEEPKVHPRTALKEERLIKEAEEESIKQAPIATLSEKESFKTKSFRNKSDVLDYFRGLYNQITDNYMIEHFLLNGLLEYNFITDFADLSTKTIFDFPNAFWHNQDRHIIYNKWELLKRDGWKLKQFQSFDEIIVNNDYITDDSISDV